MPAVRPIVDRLRWPVRVAVTGRPGVGRDCVAAALRRRGWATATPAAGEVLVLVIAETVTGEDRAALAAARGPALVVLTKADLAGPDDPLATATRWAGDAQRLTGVPTVPLVGLLAALDHPLDDELVDALRVFVTAPPDLTSVDAFVARPHVVAAVLRERLLLRLDRFGVAHAVRALSDGVDAGDLGARLAAASGIDGVLVALDAVAAPVRYLRLRAAVRELRCLAVESGDDELLALRAADATAMAVMTAAVDVLEAAGLSVDRGDTASAHLARAVRWRRYGRGPVAAVHGQCSADVVRGSLRLLADAREPSA
ncbi:hypothetical protein H7I40_06050 [Mycolicibacterium madagascariense]|nr:hypothetical protein [Mycolicibacterium madagascariense]